MKNSKKKNRQKVINAVYKIIDGCHVAFTGEPDKQVLAAVDKLIGAARKIVVTNK